MRNRWLGATVAAGAAGVLGLAMTAPTSSSAATASPAPAPTGPSHHVVVLSVDGMHQQDLEWYVNHYPNSAIASLVHGGSEYTGAMTPFPSDSFPGTVGIFTGGNPSSTGVYYDDTFNHSLLPAGTTSCTGVRAAPRWPTPRPPTST